MLISSYTRLLVRQDSLLLGRAVFRANSSGLASLKLLVENELHTVHDAGTWKTERTIVSPQGPGIRVAERVKMVLNFCANNYLGLSNHPAVIKASKNALTSHGAGLSSVRFICGTMDIHKDLENKIAQFHGREDAILYPSCFDANAGMFEVLLNESDAVISDELNHASLIDGIRLCKARRFRYRHLDMEHLEQILKETADCRTKMVVTDGVFSMDGVVTPLKEICDLADKYSAVVFIDECHATGLLGKTGRGTEEHCGLGTSRVDLINSTLGKAMGGASGGYTTGPSSIIDLLRQRSRPYLFSNSIPPAVVGAASEAFDLISKDDQLIQKLQINTTRFRTAMKAAGFTISGDDCHPICPIMLGDARLAAEFADKMLEHDIYVIGFSYPVVPKGKARIRVQLSAAHDLTDVDRAINAFIDVGRELKVIQS